mmetsp:Transcript_5412/g.20319  ORF Transcript_5412/g.20319 Transcript_5412/m.20319 type:complete len:461 (+) Transcript_5412:1263-2645(+)
MNMFCGKNIRFVDLRLSVDPRCGVVLDFRLRLAGEHGVSLLPNELARASHLTGEVGHAFRLLRELILALLDALAEPVVDLQAVDNLVGPVAVGPARHGEDDALLDAVRVTVGAHSRAEPVTLRRGGHQALDRVRDGNRGGRGGRAPPLLDEEAAAGLNRGGEVGLQPRVVVNDVHGLLASDLRVDEVGHLRGGMVTPDGDVGHGLVEDARLERQLALGAVLVEAGQRVKVAAVEVGRILHRDERVGVARVAHHAHLARGLGHRVQRLALLDEDGAVHLEEVRALHTRPSGLGADEQRPIRIHEDVHGIDADGNLAQEREEGVLELHGDALERLARSLGSQEPERHRLVGAVHLAGGDLEEQVVADLSRRAGHRDDHGLLPGRGLGGVVLGDVVLQLEDAEGRLGGGRGDAKGVAGGDPGGRGLDPERGSANGGRRADAAGGASVRDAGRGGADFTGKGDG